MQHEGPPIDYRVFGSIPRFPEEPWPYDGAPRSTGDSIFLGQDLPLLDPMIAFLEGYDSHAKRDEQRGKALFLAHQLLMHPSEYPLPEVFDAFTALTDTYPDAVTRLRQDLPKALQEQARATVEQATAERQLPLLTVIAKNPTHAELARSIMRDWFRFANSQERTVRMMYELLTGALRSNDPDVEHLAAHISSFLTDIVPDTSNQAAYYAAAAYSGSDDVLGMQMAVDDAISLLRYRYIPDFDMKSQSIYNKIHTHPIMIASHQREATVNPFRFAAIKAFYLEQERLRAQQSTTLAMVEHNVRANPPFPENLAYRQSELRSLYSARLALLLAEAHEHMQSLPVTLPDGTVHPLVDENIRMSALGLLADVYRKGHGVVEHPQAVLSTLEFLGPPLLDRKLNVMATLHEQRTLLKTGIWENASYTVSPRGDRLPVDHPVLNELGLREVVFHLGRTAMETRVTLIIGAYALPLTLDRYYHLKGRNAEELPLSQEARNWWEGIVLTYLHPLVTGKGDSWVDVHRQRSGSRSRVHSEDQLASAHRGFRRKLPAGQCFTEQQQRALDAAGITINLTKYNADRNLTRTEGQYTWVLPKFDATTALGEPMTVIIPHAADSLLSQVGSGDSASLQA